MSKKEFLKKLKRELKALPTGETNRAIDYYSELIDDRMEAGSTEEAAVDAMGDVYVAASGIMADAAERGVTFKKNSHTAGWAILTILLILVSICALAFCAWAFITKVLGEDLSLAKIEWTERTAVYEITKDGEITVDMSRSDLYFGVSEDEKIHVTYYECDSVKVDVEHTDSSLKMVQKGKLLWFYDMFGSDNKRQAQVLVPAGFEGHIDSSVTTGETRVDGLICPAGSVGLHATTGDFIIYDSMFQTVQIAMTTGDLIMGRCTLGGGFTVKGTTGDVDLDAVVFGNASLKTTTGGIKLNGCVGEEVTAELTTGGITFENVTAGKATLHSTTGGISVDGLKAMEINLATTTGSISGTLDGSITDYTIESSVSTGHNSLPSSFGSGERKLFAKATTGSIDIFFAENN